MCKIIIPAVKLFLLLVISSNCFSQTETFDIATYTPPKDFKKESNQRVVTYSHMNATTGSFCMIAIHASTVSAGNEQKDFIKEWKDLVVTPYKAEANPKTETQTSPDGWKQVTAATAVKQDGIDFYVILTVFSGFGKTSSMLVNLNDQAYLPQVDSLLSSMELDKTKAVTNTSPTIQKRSFSRPPGLCTTETVVRHPESVDHDGGSCGHLGSWRR